MIPKVTFSLTLLALAIHFLPGVADHMIYDRQAILSGQFWRLWSGHWVHFTHAHLIINLLGFFIAGCMIEHKNYPGLLKLCFLSAGFISLALLLVKPELAYYAGISGVTYAAIIYFALYGLADAGYWRVLCWVILIGTVVKLALELAQDSFLFVDGKDAFVELPLSHLFGTLIALCLYVHHVLPSYWSKNFTFRTLK